MESLLNQKKTKEKVLSFLLVFLILLVPISILTSPKESNVVITGLYTEEFNKSAQLVSFRVKSNSESDLHCKLRIELFRQKVMVDKFFKEVGFIPSMGIVEKEMILRAPSGENDFLLTPECWSVN